MKRLRVSHIAILIASIGCVTLPELTGVSNNVAHAQEAMKAEVGKIVQAANDLFKSKKYREALSKLQETDRVGNKTANESFTIERMRLAIASSAGDNDMVIRTAEIVIAANKLSNREQLQLIQVLANAYFKARNYAKAAKTYERYYNDGGTDPSARQYMIHAMSLGGNTAGAMKEVKADMAAAERSGRAPSLSTLEFFANGALRSGDKAGYASALEKMITFHGKKEYWNNLLVSIERKSDFAGRLNLDLARLKLAVGQFSKERDYIGMIEMAIQEGYPAEAIKVIDQGYKAGVLGVGKDAARHGRLRDLAKTRLAASKAKMVKDEAEALKAEDGSALANVGYAHVTTGDYKKGIELIEQGIKMDNLKYPEDAELHLGLAYLQAGKKSNAIKVFKKLNGKDGTGDLARYWIIQASQK
jgi:tetratricopeptide (TPR) repeat protein